MEKRRKRWSVWVGLSWSGSWWLILGGLVVGKKEGRGTEEFIGCEALGGPIDWTGHGGEDVYISGYVKNAIE